MKYTFFVLLMILYKCSYEVLHFEKYDHLIFLKLDKKIDTSLYTARNCQLALYNVVCPLSPAARLSAHV